MKIRLLIRTLLFIFKRITILQRLQIKRMQEYSMCDKRISDQDSEDSLPLLT